MDFFAKWVPYGTADLGSLGTCLQINLMIDPELPNCRYLVGCLMIPENYAKTDWNLSKISPTFYDPVIYVTLKSPKAPKWVIPNKDVDTSYRIISPKAHFLPFNDSVNWLLSNTQSRCEELYMTNVRLVYLNKLEVPPHLNAFQRTWKGITSLFR